MITPRIFSSLGETLIYIARHPDCTINQISEALCLSPRSIWEQIGKLRRAELIRVRREGRRHHYTVYVMARVKVSEARRAEIETTLADLFDNIIRGRRT